MMDIFSSFILNSSPNFFANEVGNSPATFFGVLSSFHGNSHLDPTPFGLLSSKLLLTEESTSLAAAARDLFLDELQLMWYWLLKTQGLHPVATLSSFEPSGPFGSSFVASNSELFFEIFRSGLFHGLFFSLPFSIPMLICFRRYILDGFSLGNYAFAGTLLGHLSFLFCTINGIRPIIHFWYPFEPILSLFGLALSLKVATDFFSQRRFVFDGTLGSSEDSSAYAMNPWPKIPEISWLLPTELERKTPPILLSVLRFPKIVFSAVQQSLRAALLSKWLEPVRIPFQKFENFCKKNLGPSIFTFQFFLMWLNPASASTLNLLFFDHEILQGVFLAPNLPIFLFYTIGFLFAAGALCTFLLFLIYQFAGRNLGALFASGRGAASQKMGRGPSTLFQLGSRMIEFDEALAQNRFKILNKFFAFLIIGCVVQGGLNYTWRLFLQYPLEMIHWNFLTTLTKNLRIFDRPLSRTESTLLGTGLLTETPSDLQKVQEDVQHITLAITPQTVPKELFQKSSFPSAGGPISGTKLGFELPVSEAADMELASSSFLAKVSDSIDRKREGFPTKGSVGAQKTPQDVRSRQRPNAGVSTRHKMDAETYWKTVEKNQDFLGVNSASGGSGQPLSEAPVINFPGRREFPPYDTSIRNREKNLPVERHLAIERVNSRRGLMGRPPLENEERENAIFKYHTFFMNQIDRAAEDFKMKLVLPPDLYREEDDILALEKLHANYLKQKGRESEYQNSVMNPFRSNGGGSNQKSSRFSRHDRDFFTKSRPITNTRKGFSKSSYIRDLFDPNLQEAYSAYSHDDLLLEKIISNSALRRK